MLGTALELLSACKQSANRKVTEGWAPECHLLKCNNRPYFFLPICYTPLIPLRHRVPPGELHLFPTLLPQPELAHLREEGWTLDIVISEAEVVGKTTSAHEQTGQRDKCARSSTAHEALPEVCLGSAAWGQPDVRSCSLWFAKDLGAIFGCEFSPQYIMFSDICKVWVLLLSRVFWNAALHSLYLV